MILIEVKIPKEIRSHKESIFFGLSVRQFVCAVLAVSLAAGIYLGLGGIVGKEAASWLCLLIAAPVAVAGFFHYNGMTLEQFLWAFLKSEIANVALSTDDDIIIIDAEREYGPIARALGGEVIEISPNSQHHINPLDLEDGYDDGENPIAMKSELITSILEQQMGAGLLTGSQKSIIDRCTASVYQSYFHAKGALPMPLLTDWRAEVLKQPDPEAREIALAAELITEGSLNVFAHPTNVNIGSRIVVLDLYEMGEQLRPTALVVALEAIQNRVMENRKHGKYTWVFLDEVCVARKSGQSAHSDGIAGDLTGRSEGTA